MTELGLQAGTSRSSRRESVSSPFVTEAEMGAAQDVFRKRRCQLRPV